MKIEAQSIDAEPYVFGLLFVAGDRVLAIDPNVDRVSGEPLLEAGQRGTTRAAI
jgi:hypothetical protein